MKSRIFQAIVLIILCIVGYVFFAPSSPTIEEPQYQINP